ncbi:hypothetical protein C8Q79DRAFT_483076 [Trametes meyenii]|nr:hypothetical protein C8Q79DRAFT_483076 [Trametes meyenii]
MLGQRIIESYADLENENSSLLRAEPCTGLTIRRIKSAGLRIVTESELPSPGAPDGVLQDQTNTLYPPSRHPYSRLSVRTPDTSHTFGLPNPSMLSPSYARSPRSFSATPSSASTERHIARRLSRYSRAESALHSAVEVSSTEVSPHELQIRVLEQATAMLSEQARDAQACAERLRACLADKELSLEELKTLQRERWLEEHKSNARQSQSAQARELLTKLSSPVQEAPLFDSPSAMSRQEANLARFLRRSPTRVVLPLVRNPSMSPVSPYRRETISQVRPMRLRASAMELALRSPLRVHTRSRSLDSGHSRSNSESTDATFVSRGSSGQTTVAQASSAQPKGLPSNPPPLLPHSIKGDVGGVVSIAALAKLRPRDELLAEVGDVALPDYAVDLLEDLVASSLDISLRDVATVDRAPAIHAHSESSPDITFPSPSSPAADVALAEPSPPPRTLGRQRSQSDGPPSPTFPGKPATSVSPRRRAGASPKSSFRQSLLVPKFSSLRLSSPSLLPVPEGSSGDARSRPQSSMSGYPLAFDSSSAVHESGSTDTDMNPERAGDHRRFSVISFRRLEGEGRRSESVVARIRRRLSSLGR